MTAIETLRQALRTGYINQEEHAALDRIERVVEAVQEAKPWWFHEAHGLHDDQHHAWHRPLDICVPLLERSPELRESLESLDA